MFYGEKKEFKDITVVVYPSYKKFLPLYNGQFDCLIQDECDLLLSDEFRRLTILTKAQYKYWLTWTPYNDSFKREDMWLRRGRIVEAKTYNEWLKNQFDYEIYGVETGDEVEEYEHYRDLKHTINGQKSKLDAIKFCIEQWLIKGKRVLVMTDTKDFTNKIWEELWYATMTGDMSKKERTLMFEKFDSTKVLCAIGQLIWRWYDNPEIDVIVIAFSWRAESPILQSVGRWLRSSPGKDKVVVYDIYSPTKMMKYQWYKRKTYYEQFTKDIQNIRFK